MVLSFSPPWYRVNLPNDMQAVSFLIWWVSGIPVGRGQGKIQYRSNCSSWPWNALKWASVFSFVKSLFLPAKRDSPLRTAPTGVSPPAWATTWFFLCNRGSLNMSCFSLKFPDRSVMFRGYRDNPTYSYCTK